MMYCDCNAHFLGFDDAKVKEICEQSKVEGMDIVIAAGMDLESAQRAVNIAQTYDIVYGAIGIHPLNILAPLDEATLSQLKALARSEKVVAISEIGLDFLNNFLYPEQGVPDDAAREVQKQALIQHIGLARELDKLLILHNRGADRELLDILRQETGVIAILHHFIGDENMLTEAVEIGCYFTEGLALINPSVIPNIEQVREMIKKIPDERLLLESDMHTGDRTGVRMPWEVKVAAAEIAKLRETTTEEIGRISTNNLRRLLKMPLLP
ncbi:TatD family hydrolase [Chloroflexota bacterium]